MNNIGTYVKSVLIPLVLGGIVGFIISGVMDYDTLTKPFLAPPGIVFPIVWTTLYLLMGVSYGILKTKGLTDEKVNQVYYLQLVINALWSIFFFSLEWSLFSFFWIIALIIAVIAMIREFYARDKASGLLQIPYLIWLLFAAYLNLAIYLLNR